MKAETARLPSVSIVIPTLNSGKTLPACLDSIAAQEYEGKVEVVVADGGSIDGTVKIARERGCAVVENPKRTGEAGKARGLKEASGEIVALIDSDNILPDAGWLDRMVRPMEDPLIAGSEPLEFTYRETDRPLTRYCALLGMNDPLCHFLGNYDRLNTLTGRWTGYPVDARDRGGWLEVRLEPGAIPTIGANGFMVRKKLLDLLEVGDYLFDIDIPYELVKLGHNRFAKVKTGIVHLYGSGLGDFTRKQLRRVRDYHYYKARGMRSYPWKPPHYRRSIARFIASCLLVAPLIYEAVKGYLRMPDPAWLLHPPACLITLFVYAWGVLEGALAPREQARTRWRQ